MSTSLAVAFGNMIVLTNGDSELRDAALEAWAPSVQNAMTLSPDLSLFVFTDKSLVTQNKRTMELISFDELDDLLEWLEEHPAHLFDFLSLLNISSEAPA